MEKICPEALQFLNVRIEMENYNCYPTEVFPPDFFDKINSNSQFC